MYKKALVLGAAVITMTCALTTQMTQQLTIEKEHVLANNDKPAATQLSYFANNTDVQTAEQNEAELNQTELNEAEVLTCRKNKSTQALANNVEDSTLETGEPELSEEQVLACCKKKKNQASA